MITQNLANIIPPATINDGLATMKDVAHTIAPSVIVDNSVCVCKCEYVEQVFSESGTITITDWNKNDKTTLLFKKAISVDTIIIKLIKSDGTSATITDDTYGKYYPGTLTIQPLYWCFIVDWNKIFTLLGGGLYYFEITTIIIGITQTIDTIYYQLQVYSDMAADKTVRIETYNTGNILSSQFNYTDLFINGFYQSFRIRGKLMPKIPKFTTDTYTDQDNNILQIRNQIKNEYDLIINLIPAEIADKLIYDNMLANIILISDYNIFNEDVKRQISLLPIEISKKTWGYQNFVSFEIKLTEEKDNIIKNNF
jgi:hypothetical protein